jgi:hypothetical protein
MIEIASHDSQIRNRIRPGGFSCCGQEPQAMKHKNGMFGIVLGGIVALAAMLFIFSGGTLGGKTTIEGDQDLPPIATADQN